MLARVRSLFLTALLALGLVVSGQAIALAKGAAPATGVMVLCTGHGAVVVFTDADGQPTAAPHLCPDCMVKALSALSPPQVAAVPLDTAGHAAAWPSPNATLPQIRLTGTRARAPPLSV